MAKPPSASTWLHVWREKAAEPCSLTWIRRVTARWGYALTVPPAIKEATLVLSSRLYKKGLSAHIDIVSADQYGTMAFRELSSTELSLLLDGSRLYKPAIGRR